ncbi:MAG: L-histidine N(alpha)-methyltransferase, partial [Candidatus Marsarchaeota archaeon]|nr:L-histidine N(alpha)-methyltransferase [Candidatus Marsarchaeota archaeon]
MALSMLRTQNPSPRVWYLNEAKLWYLDKEGVEAYQRFSESHDYKTNMQDTETDLYTRNMQKILELLVGDRLSFLDLGCGDAYKTIEVIKKIKIAGKEVMFYPVDISAAMLKRASANAAKSGIPAFPLQGDFDKGLEVMLDKVNFANQRFFNLGANFVNFDKDKILSRFNGVMTGKDVIYFSAQLSDKDPAYIVRQYIHPDTEIMTFAILKQLGFEKNDVEYGARFNSLTHQVELYYIVDRVPDKLKRLGMKDRDEVVVITSYKP